MKIVQYVRTWWERAMTEPDINSRIVYLGHAIIIGVCVLAVTADFIRKAHDVSAHPTMLWTLLGGGAAVSAGRMMTKLGTKKSADAPKEKGKDEAGT